MNFFRLLPVILSFLLLGAHFYRAGIPLLTVMCGIAPALLFVRKSWVPRLFQGLLFLGAVEWLRTLYELAAVRISLGEPWTRMAMILGIVALLTGLSGLVFRNRKLKSRYSAA